MIDANLFAEHEAKYRAGVQRETWGHLRAKPRKKHRARIVFTLAGYSGAYQIITARVSGVSDSPWLYDHMMSYVMRKARHGRVHVFEGTYYATKSGRGVFTGKCRRVPGI